MAKTKATRRLSHAARTGLRELPANAAWVLSKAIKPVAQGASQAADNVSDMSSAAADTVGSAATVARRKTVDARRSVADVVPGLGRDSVTSLMRQADSAAAPRVRPRPKRQPGATGQRRRRGRCPGRQGVRPGRPAGPPGRSGTASRPGSHGRSKKPRHRWPRWFASRRNACGEPRQQPITGWRPNARPRTPKRAKPCRRSRRRPSATRGRPKSRQSDRRAAPPPPSRRQTRHWRRRETWRTRRQERHRRRQPRQPGKPNASPARPGSKPRKRSVGRTRSPWRATAQTVLARATARTGHESTAGNRCTP